MPSSAFGNNFAPTPVSPTTNPTGTSSPFGSTTGAYPSYPVFGPMGVSNTGPSANQGTFGANAFTSLSSGFNLDPAYANNFYKETGRAFGKGTGSLIDYILQGGLFNPQVAQAFLNAMQPGINRGEANILTTFGNEGNRFGSSTALGLGDYLSQVNLNEQQTLAGLFENAQQNQLSLLENILPTLHGEQANHSGIFDDILGGLAIAGGAIAAPFTGGATIPLIGAGISTIGAGNAPGGGGGSAVNTSGLANLFSGALSSTFNNVAQNNYNADVASQSELDAWINAQSGSVLGGADPSSTNTNPLSPGYNPFAPDFGVPLASNTLQ